MTVDLGSVNNAQPDTAHYAYDGAGMRVRKVVVQGQRRYERIYWGRLSSIANTTTAA